MWSVSTIIQGLISFMSSEDVTAGSITTDNNLRRDLARSSLKYNVKNKKFVQLFPDLVKLHKERSTATPGAAAAASGGSTQAPRANLAQQQGADVAGAAAGGQSTAGAAAETAKRKAEAEGICGTGVSGFSVFVSLVVLLSLGFIFLGEDDVSAGAASGDYEL